MIKKTKLVIALIVAITMFAGSASAFDPDDLQKLKDTNECVECDLRVLIWRLLICAIRQ